MKPCLPYNGYGHNCSMDTLLAGICWLLVILACLPPHKTQTQVPGEAWACSRYHILCGND